MSDEKKPTLPHADRQDQTLRLAMAATALGMTMGIAPTAVLSADAPQADPAAGTLQSADPKPAAGYIKFDSIKGERADSGNKAKSAAGYVKFDSIEGERAAAGTEAKPAAGHIKFDSIKGERADSGTEAKPAAASQPGVKKKPARR